MHCFFVLFSSQPGLPSPSDPVKFESRCGSIRIQIIHFPDLIHFQNYLKFFADISKIPEGVEIHGIKPWLGSSAPRLHSLLKQFSKILGVRMLLSKLARQCFPPD